MAYIFDPPQLAESARRAVGLPHDEMVRAVTADLAKAYPRHVETRQEWVLNLTGGATGIMTVLHASLSEYLLIFGTPVGTEGFSGRYRIDIHDFVLSGEMWTYTENGHFPARTIFRPGDATLLPRRQTKGFRLAEETWLLEYGRGPILTCVPMALTDAIVSLDGSTIWKTLRISTRLMLKELRQGKV